MWEGFGYLGLLVVLGYLIKILAGAARDSGLEEFTLFRFRFRSNEKPPKRLKG